MKSRTNVKVCGLVTWAVLIGACGSKPYAGPSIGRYSATAPATADVVASVDDVVQRAGGTIRGKQDAFDNGGRASIAGEAGLSKGTYFRVEQSVSFDRPLDGGNASGAEDLFLSVGWLPADDSHRLGVEVGAFLPTGVAPISSGQSTGVVSLIAARSWSAGSKDANHGCAWITPNAVFRDHLEETELVLGGSWESADNIAILEVGGRQRYRETQDLDPILNVLTAEVFGQWLLGAQLRYAEEDRDAVIFGVVLGVRTSWIPSTSTGPSATH